MAHLHVLDACTHKLCSHISVSYTCKQPSTAVERKQNYFACLLCYVSLHLCKTALFSHLQEGDLPVCKCTQGTKQMHCTWIR